MRYLSVFLIFVILYTSWPLRVQAQTASTGLIVKVIHGEGGHNSIKSHTGMSIEIEVRDEQTNVVSGARIIFQLPSFGPSGSFPGGQLTEQTTTGRDGRATMAGFVPNDVLGQFNIKITADSGDLHGNAVTSLVNLAEIASDKPKSHTGLWLLIAAGAGGAVAAGVLAGSKGTSTATVTPSAPSVTVSVGSIAVGGPH